MQVLFLSTPATITLCCVAWLLFQSGAALISKRLPRDWMSPDRLLFRERAWEQGGKRYAQLFHVHRWKNFVPDGAAILRKGYRKKHLTDYSEANLSRFLEESCRAELTHLLAIPPFVLFGLIGPPRIIAYMLAYALAVNLPCVLIQRYNRPRIRALCAHRARRHDITSYQNRHSATEQTLK